MHVIRLREPWTATRELESGVLVYTRKFHRPTGVAEQRVELCLGLLPGALPDKLDLSVVINGRPLTGAVHTADEVRFGLVGLMAFNTLELRVDTKVIDRSVVPVWGSYGIRSVELQIE